jgi:hypothetical protein
VKRFRAVAQQDEYGCGAACVASILGISYGRAVELLGKDPDTSPYGYGGRQIRHALARFDVTYRNRRLSKIGLDNIPVGSLVFAKPKGYGHYLVRTLDGWMDPWRNAWAQPREGGFRLRAPPGTCDHRLRAC